MIKKVIILLTIFSMAFSLLFSEENGNSLNEEIKDEEVQTSQQAFIPAEVNVPPLSPDFYKPTIVSHFTAFGETFGSNLVLMAINRYIRKAPYAYISWESIKKNLTNPWVWDQDEFVVNHLGHPYQGSYYYIAGRSNNLPFWESALTTIAGSVTWELFAETETPSYNDLIVTTIGGISLGEMLHRLYFQAADLNKLFAFFVSPMDSINNTIWQGKVNRPYGEITSLSTKLLFGAIADKIFFKESEISGKPIYIPLYLGGNINIVYGNPYGLETKTPYQQFDLDVKFTAAKNYYNLSLFSDGMIWAFSPWEQDRLKTTMGISLHYDFLFSSAMNYSANSIGFTTKQHAILPHGWNIKWDLHLNYIMMSATDFYYLFNGIIDPETELENRIYDLGFGTGFKASFGVSQPLFGSLYLFYFLDWVKTIKTSLPQKGSNGSSLIGVGSISYEHSIYKTLSLGLEYSSYIKSAFYTDIEDTYEYNHFINLYLKTKFK